MLCETVLLTENELFCGGIFATAKAVTRNPFTYKIILSDAVASVESTATTM